MALASPLYYFSMVSGQSYYVNKYTKESQWDMPNKPAERGPGSEKVFFEANVPQP
jgi:WW domain